jgi:hypothetical protein
MIPTFDLNKMSTELGKKVRKGNNRYALLLCMLAGSFELKVIGAQQYHH